MDFINVVLTETGEVVTSIDVTGKSGRAIEKTAMGLLRNMNLDAYHVEYPRAVQAGTAQGETK